jgi:hypothetical protein
MRKQIKDNALRLFFAESLGAGNGIAIAGLTMSQRSSSINRTHLHCP